MSTEIPKRPYYDSGATLHEFWNYEHAVAKRAVDALQAIANADHAEDGGPECDHATDAEIALNEIRASGWLP